MQPQKNKCVTLLGKNGCLISWKILVNLYIQLSAVNQPSCYNLFLLIGHITQNGTTQLGASKSRHFVRIDHYWSKIGKVRDDAGQYKFKHLASVANCVLSLSHGNAALERGFSLNKNFLDIHGNSIQGETITALRIGLLR